MSQGLQAAISGTPALHLWREWNHHAKLNKHIYDKAFEGPPNMYCRLDASQTSGRKTLNKESTGHAPFSGGLRNPPTYICLCILASTYSAHTVHTQQDGSLHVGGEGSWKFMDETLHLYKLPALDYSLVSSLFLSVLPTFVCLYRRVCARLCP